MIQKDYHGNQPLEKKGLFKIFQSEIGIRFILKEKLLWNVNDKVNRKLWTAKNKMKRLELEKKM